MFNLTAFISTLIIVIACATIFAGGVCVLFNRYWSVKLAGLVVVIFTVALLVSHITALLVS